MAIYTYQAYTRDGKKTKGSLEALNEQEAKEKIRASNLILSHLATQKGSAKLSDLSRDSLIIFTSQLAQLITARIPLYESILALEEQSRGEPYHTVIQALGERIKAGTSLSKAMAEFPNSFSPLYRALISAGEAIGNMELSLTRLASLLSYQQKMRKQLLGALTYPIFLLGLMILSLGIMIGFVVPSLESLFDGRELPWFTATVFGTSRLLRTNWPYLLLLAGGAGTAAYYYFRKKTTQIMLQRLFLKTPIIGRYIIYSALSRFSRTLATLTEGGLPLINSLHYSTEAIHNVRLEEIFKEVTDRAIEGRIMSDELKKYKEIPPLFCRMLKIGEESGKLAPMLLQVASIYDEDTERTLSKIVTLAQPVLLIVMGALIGGVILSILMPLSDFGAGMEM